jgi:hypothetical protein
MANITWVFPDDDDPIFPGAFTVSFPINFQPQEISMAQRRPYVHSPEPEEAEHVPWTIHVPLASEQASHLTWIEGEASPDDPMFGRMHVALISDPEED